MEITNPTNTQIAKELYACFAKGDIPGLLDLLTNDIKWTCPGPKDILPYTGVFTGKQGVTEFLRLINENKEFPKFEPREYIAEGDKVVTLGH